MPMGEKFRGFKGIWFYAFVAFAIHALASFLVRLARILHNIDLDYVMLHVVFIGIR